MKIEVLDKGYVDIKDDGTLGSDVTVVNAARVSFNKSKTSIDDKDKALLKYLLKNDHTSPFRHCMIQFEVKAPLMVCRQMWKYVVGSDHTMDAWNEVSRRYVKEEPEFYVPEYWRRQSQDNKQGSVEEEVVGNDYFFAKYDLITRYALTMYNNAVTGGMAIEQARMFLPAYAMYTTWYWTASLWSVLHFINQRDKPDAQYEIREYAKAIRKLIRDKFPEAMKAYEETKC